MTKPFDPTKPVQTREGLEVELFSQYKGAAGKPLLGVYKFKDAWHTCSWGENGKFYTSGAIDEFDLVNVPEKVAGWYNVYKDDDKLYGPHETKEDADSSTIGERIACIYIEYELGEGLSDEL